MVDPLKSKLKLFAYSAGIFAGGAAAAAALGWSTLTANPSIRTQPQVSEAAVASAVDLSNAFVSIAEAVTPAVVRIEAERPTRGAGGMGNVPDDMLRFFGFPPGETPQQPPTQTAGGSGFIVSEDGYILTNDHVIAGASRITVTLPDRRQYTATLVGADPTTDVAVLKIEDRNLPTLSFGSSRDVRVGEWVLAVGNPGFGGGSSLDYTVTAGIISALGRPLELLRRELQSQGSESFQFAIEDFIQTDAVINPGNSGGPMVNVRGQVVGINSAIASRTGYYQGYGFAIPIDLARRVMEDLVEFGQVRRPLLGVSMINVELEDAEVYGLPRPVGALVQSVVPGGPAEAAGMRPEDVIVAIDGEAVERSSQLQLLVAQRRPGDRISVRFYRDGRPQEVSIRLGEADIGPAPARTTNAVPAADERLGIQVGPLDAQGRERFGLSADAGGVVITQVVPNGAAARRGLAPGGLITEINRTPVGSVDAVRQLLGSVESGEVVSFRVQYGDQPSSIFNIRVP
jgi:serine protease Do